MHKVFNLYTILNPICPRSCEIIMDEKTPLAHEVVCAFRCLILGPRNLIMRAWNRFQIFYWENYFCFTRKLRSFRSRFSQYLFYHLFILGNYQLCQVPLKKVDTIGNKLLIIIVIIKPNLVTSHGERLIV